MASAVLSLLRGRALPHRGVVLRTAAVGFAVAGLTSGNVMPSTPRVAHASTATPDDPATPQRYDLLERRRISPDTCLLKFGVPSSRAYLGSDPLLPTCLKVTMPAGTHGTDSPALSKSYSPISHPATEHVFELLVKAYPYQEGGGVGAYLCSLTPTEDACADDDNGVCEPSSSSIVASLKAPRSMHGSPVLLRRWRHVGLVAGGTGIAPLYQLAVTLLRDDTTHTVSLLFVNRHEEDMLLREELEALVSSSHGRFRVTHSLTGEDHGSYESGRGTVDSLRRALPPSSSDDDTMIFVCGTDGFVEFWGGPVGRAPPKADGTKGPKIQGPLLGLLRDAGYRESEVFKY